MTSENRLSQVAHRLRERMSMFAESQSDMPQPTLPALLQEKKFPAGCIGFWPSPGRNARPCAPISHGAGPQAAGPAVHVGRNRFVCLQDQNRAWQVVGIIF